MSANLDRYLEIMRRTGLPVIVAAGDGEPVIMMPLDAYETLIGADTPGFGATPGSAAHTPVHNGVEEIAVISQKIKETGEKSSQGAESIEDRFFLDPIE